MIKIKYNNETDYFNEYIKNNPDLIKKDILSFEKDKINIPDIYNDSKLSSASGSLINEKIENIINLAKNIGWKEAIKKIYYNDQDFLTRIFSANRINWLSIINNLERGSKILDLGSGMGAVSIQIAKKNEYDVTALDASLSNLRFLNEVSKQEKLNISTVHSNLDYLPFADNQFDLVYMIGSIEWLYFYSKTNLIYSEFIKNYLAECYRILKKGGKIYIASENSSYIGYFFDIKEAHTMLKYMSLLEHNEANQLSEYFRKSKFTEITFNHDSIKDLLLKNNFTNFEFFWLYPDYSTPNYIIPLSEDENVINYFIDQRMNPWDFAGQREKLYNFYKLIDKKLIKYFIEHYGAVAEK
jgi:ubiquinone/menaquinone biosynthesis C-methylase UbiE